MHQLCSKLFNSMLKFSYCPPDMKKGVITVLHKGGNKPLNDPNNYRAITLTPVLLKLYESILLKRIESKPSPIHELQGGFRKGIGCMMTSFLFKESVQFARENNSKLYACFLDVRKAFDNVWHEALLVKLYKTGIDLYLFKAIFNLYQDMSSCVRSNGFTSDWFPVLQGTQQGGVLSPYMYLIFINDLIDRLVKCPFGLTMYSINCTCPTAADDMVLLSLSNAGLQSLMNICFEYSTKFRYTYNASKSAVVVANDNSRGYPKEKTNWYLGNDDVSLSDTYTHLGVPFNKDLDLTLAIEECKHKLRKTFFGIMKCGIYENGIHPISAKHLYVSVVLPTALYGCELWSNLSKEHLAMLEASHRFCIKYIQNLPEYTRTDVALSLIGMLPIEAEIDKRKLIFLGQVCSLNPSSIIKKVFAQRLMSYKNNAIKASGFVPDIFRLCRKYNLLAIVNNYISSGRFPSKLVWKRIVSNNISIVYSSEINARIAQDDLLKDLTIVHPMSCNQISDFWRLSKNERGLLKHSQFIVKLIGKLFSRPYTLQCKHCCGLTECMPLHIFINCPRYFHQRNAFWGNIVNTFGETVYLKLVNFSPREQLLHLISGLKLFVTEDDEIISLVNAMEQLQRLFNIANSVDY